MSCYVLGHVVSLKEIEVQKAKIEVISKLPSPKTIREVCSFLGYAGFYRRFIKNFNAISRPLCNHLIKDTPFELMCDASDFAVGAVLGQKMDHKSFVIHYVSKTLDSTQMNYSTTEKALLGVVYALNKFRSYLLGSKTVVFIDHTAVRYLMTKQDAKPRLIR